MIFQRSPTKQDDGYDVFAQFVVTTGKYRVISAQMTNLVVVAVALVKSNALHSQNYSTDPKKPNAAYNQKSHLICQFQFTLGYVHTGVVSERFQKGFHLFYRFDALFTRTN